MAESEARGGCRVADGAVGDGVCSGWCDDARAGESSDGESEGERDACGVSDLRSLHGEALALLTLFEPSSLTSGRRLRRSGVCPLWLWLRRLLLLRRRCRRASDREARDNGDDDEADSAASLMPWRGGGGPGERNEHEVNDEDAFSAGGECTSSAEDTAAAVAATTAARSGLVDGPRSSCGGDGEAIRAT